MEKNCPCCNRHCPADNLHCPTGRKYFGIEDKDSPADHPVDSNKKMILLLRKCGHFLHHNVGQNDDTTPLVNALTSEERITLEYLLEKCLDCWSNLPKDETTP